MKRSNINERRDPAAGVLKLGTLLSSVRKEGQSGQIEIRDQGQTHAIRIVGGTIADVSIDGADRQYNYANLRRIIRDMERLFILPRPHVLFEQQGPKQAPGRGLDPNTVVLSGVAKRQDLFEPIPLVERIPVNTLKLEYEQLGALLRLPLTPPERAFLEKLSVPTPIPMILWKRGLNPRHAGALLVALNLIGIWSNQWAPGDLPRNGTATQISRKISSGLPDHELLGIGTEADAAEVDRAFRKLSLEIHPDRLIGMPVEEIDRARKAFQGVSAAYGRLKHTRRSRPVRPSGEPIGRVKLVKNPIARWAPLVAEARKAKQRGEKKRAQAFAIKALAMSPSSEIVRELAALLRYVA
jgi:DnaJ-like protein